MDVIIAFAIGTLLAGLPAYWVHKSVVAKLRADLIGQQDAKVASAKTAAFAEMAGHATRAINTPLGALLLTAQSIEAKLGTDPVDQMHLRKQMVQIISITSNMAGIVSAIRKTTVHDAKELPKWPAS